jgi:adenosylhomocysteine nucleosidase
LRILVAFALDLEFAPWRALHPFAKLAGDEFVAHEAAFGEAQVRVVLTGVGGVRAANAVRAALEWQPDICITVGLAGSLRAEHRIGQVLAARDIMELQSGRTIAADAALLRRAEDCKAVLIERLLTSPEMILSAEGKKRLGNMAAAVEMESFAIVAEAAAKQIPVIAIRAISDDADEDLPMDFGNILDESGNVKKAKVARLLARSPQKLPALVRLGKNSRAAAEKLAEFMERFVTELAAASGGDAEFAEAWRA